MWLKKLSSRVCVEKTLESPLKIPFFFSFLFFFFFFFFLVFRDRVSLYSPGCPGTHAVDQAGLELRNPPACLCLSSAGIKGVHHHLPSKNIFL
jgi:hypothetical protein